MALSLKPGVQLWGLHSRLVWALPLMEQIYREFGQDLVITSARDGVHKPDSKHYVGEALDLRTFTLSVLQRQEALTRIEADLGDDFDVVLEKNHLHVELDPKA